ncbi:MAG: N-acetylmuramoyl-L-alanine amidase [Cyanobacteria bacterium SIG28]|nr:N-acetylmuramoyl-L-alanine amidase [Cyanobacteria bacterium SIG28]
MENMRGLLFFLLVFFSTINFSYAYELVLPKEKKTIVDTNYAFFVGKASNTEVMSINDEKVYVAPNGAFAHSIKLKDGENRIVVKSNFNTQVYRFVKNPTPNSVKPQLIEFEPKIFLVKKDNTPIRKTPVDFGMNRLSHLFKDTYVVVNGEKGGFYRVYLTDKQEAWIAKEAVVEAKQLCEVPKFITVDNRLYKNASEHIIRFTGNLPYSVEESEKEIVFKVYNPFVSEGSVYSLNIQKPKKYYYKTELKNGVYIFKVNELTSPDDMTLKGLTVVVDAGHGGAENGAIGCLGDKEKDINLKIAQNLKDFLLELGADVIMTRECDAEISLDDRVKLAKDNSSPIFISIHLNSIGDVEMNLNKHKGTSVYYYNENSKELADVMEDYVPKSINTRRDGVKQASFAVLRPTDYIGILLEVAYMTNPNDSMIYREEGFAVETARAIAGALLEFVNK